MFQIFRERLPPGLGQPAIRLRAFPHELLRNGDVSLFLELLQMHAQVPIGHAQVVAQLGENDSVSGRQNGNNGEPAPLVQHGVELIDQSA